MTRALHALGGLQARLILASAAVVLLAVLITSVVFVYSERQQQRAEVLKRVAAATETFSLSAAPANAPSFQSFQVLPGDSPDRRASGLVAGPVSVTRSALVPDYRILLVDRSGEVVDDPAGALAGVSIGYPVNGAMAGKGYITWPGSAANATDGLTFVVPTGSPVGRGSGLTPVAVLDSKSLTADWLATAPDLAISTLVGLPVAILVAALVTRRITLPLRRLTQAVEDMADGEFDQHVEVHGRDEVATLASSFTTMAGRVKERDKQLRDLLANVSHDLRTPLTSIQGYAEALTDGVTGPGDVERAARIIQDEARHAAALLSNILVLGEIESGEVVVRHEPYDLVEVGRRCVRRLEPEARSRGVLIDLQAGDGLLLSGDEEKVERAVCNLLENAVKFARTRVEVRVDEGAGGQASMRVANDGPSIALEDEARLFDRFYRAKGPQSGTGLGLAIAREMVALNHGSVALRSAADPVEFEVLLPVSGPVG